MNLKFKSKCANKYREGLKDHMLRMEVEHKTSPHLYEQENKKIFTSQKSGSIKESQWMTWYAFGRTEIKTKTIN